MKKLKDLQILYAIAKINGEKDLECSIDAAIQYNNLNTNQNDRTYICPLCNREILFKKESIDGKRAHFAHKAKTQEEIENFKKDPTLIDCVKDEYTKYKCKQTSLHLGAKKYCNDFFQNFKEKKLKICSIEKLFKDYIFEFDEIKIEKNEEGFIPDIQFINTKENKVIAIEFALTHKIDKEKEKKLCTNYKYITIEIDIKKYEEDVKSLESYIKDILENGIYVGYKDLDQQKIKNFCDNKRLETNLNYYSLKNEESQIYEDLKILDEVITFKNSDDYKEFCKTNILENEQNLKNLSNEKNYLLKENSYLYVLMNLKDYNLKNNKNLLELFYKKYILKINNPNPNIDKEIKDFLISEEKIQTLNTNIKLQKVLEYEKEKIDKINIAKRQGGDINFRISNVEKELVKKYGLEIVNNNYDKEIIQNYILEQRELENLSKNLINNIVNYFEQIKIQLEELSKKNDEEILKISKKIKENEVKIKEYNLKFKNIEELKTNAYFNKDIETLYNIKKKREEEINKIKDERNNINNKYLELSSLENIFESKKESKNTIIIPAIKNFKEDVYSESLFNLFNDNSFLFTTISYKNINNNNPINKGFIIEKDSNANENIYAERIFLEEMNDCIFNNFNIFFDEMAFKEKYLKLIDIYNNKYKKYITFNTISLNINGIEKFLYIPNKHHNTKPKIFDIIEDSIRSRRDLTIEDLQYIQYIICAFMDEPYKEYFKNFKNEIKHFKSKKEFEEHLDYILNKKFR